MGNKLEVWITPKQFFPPVINSSTFYHNKPTYLVEMSREVGEVAYHPLGVDQTQGACRVVVPLVAYQMASPWMDPMEGREHLRKVDAACQPVTAGSERRAVVLKIEQTSIKQHIGYDRTTKVLYSDS